MIKSLIAPCLLIIIEQKKHKTKELKNKSTIDDETFISSKETSKIIWFINYSMASESFHIIKSIDFHVNKLAPENDTSESKNHFRLPFSHEDEDLPMHADVSAKTTTTRINNTNNVNLSNSAVHDTNSILIPSNTTATNNKSNH